MKPIFIRLNDEPVEIECIIDEHDETRDFQPSFWWWGRRYYLDDFIRCHFNPWIYDDFPDEIHGMENSYQNPLFIELIGDEYVNLYHEIEDADDVTDEEIEYLIEDLEVEDERI